MAPKPASTAGKAPASTASKAPAKPSEGAKAAKKTSAKPAAEATDEKKKRRKVRKETYSSYIYKGKLIPLIWRRCKLINLVSAETGTS
jgi:histone H2B